MIASDGQSRRGDEDIVVTARDLTIDVNGRMESTGAFDKVGGGCAITAGVD